ncbi:hypothetical protein Barb6XT_00386 [Bacteroidales bacterium Barb6XT]|nr:hypothetical protein Barb6XT_00386 [Bacteroidales bacterium Barb6XT]
MSGMWGYGYVTQMPRRGKRFQPHMERSGMWGYADDAGKEVLQGRPISAPHGAERNVGLWKGRPDEILKG